jgi:hypothetical protein
VWKGELPGAVGGRAPAPAHPIHKFHKQSTSTSTIHDYSGGGSLRHPLSGVCGRESCQALWGRGHPRQHIQSTFHHKQLTSTPTIHNSGGGSLRYPPSGVSNFRSNYVRRFRGWLTSTPTKWGVWKGELPGAVGGRAPARVHPIQVSQTINFHSNDTRIRGRLTSTPTKWGVWKGELPGAVGGRAPAPARPIHPSHKLNFHVNMTRLLRGWLTSTPTKWDVWKGELPCAVGRMRCGGRVRAPAPAHPIHPSHIA